MQVELRACGLDAEIEREIRVTYKGVEVGFYKADLFVNDCVIVELKVAKTYNTEDEPQLLNELKATRIKVGLGQLWENEGRVQAICILKHPCIIRVPSVAES